MNKYLITIVLALLFTPSSYAEIIPRDMHEKVIESAMNNFWGKAKLRDGTTVQPTSEYERRTLIIDRKNAYEVIKAGELSSIANWCGLNWKQNYFRVTKSARDSGLKGKQVAFIGLLHGVAMGIVDSAITGQECPLTLKNNVAVQLKKSSNKLLNWDASKTKNL